MAARDEIIAFCDEMLEIDAYSDYGPNGLQVPGRSDVSRIATGVTATLELLTRATEAGADLIITHHGLLFGDLAEGISEQLAARLKVVLCAGASVAGYHLPLDAHLQIGNNALLRDALGLSPDPRPFAEVKGRPIGVVGSSEEGLSCAELQARLEAAVGHEAIVFAGGPDEIRSVGIVSGAGASALGEAAGLRLDAVITGEPAEHVMGDAREIGVHFLAAGHYATETSGVRRLGELVAERFGVDHEFIDIPNPI